MTTSSESPESDLIVEGPSDLVVVFISTKGGAKYEFPDMSLAVLYNVLPETGRVPKDQPQLILMNYATAVLIVPFRIVDEISVFGTRRKILWQSSASTAKEK